MSPHLNFVAALLCKVREINCRFVETRTVTGGIARSAIKAAGIKFAHRAKIRFSDFAPQGRLVVPIHIKLGRADGHLDPLGCAKFHLNRCRDGNAAPKYQKFPLFW